MICEIDQSTGGRASRFISILIIKAVLYRRRENFSVILDKRDVTEIGLKSDGPMTGNSFGNRGNYSLA
jgi:hypothetical protein